MNSETKMNLFLIEIHFRSVRERRNGATNKRIQFSYIRAWPGTCVYGRRLVLRNRIKLFINYSFFFAWQTLSACAPAEDRRWSAFRMKTNKHAHGHDVSIFINLSKWLTHVNHFVIYRRRGLLYCNMYYCIIRCWFGQGSPSTDRQMDGLVESSTFYTAQQ